METMRMQDISSKDTEFVGRETEIETIKQLIKDYRPSNSSDPLSNSYIYNIHGQGGIGKTRLTKKIYESVENMYEQSEHYFSLIPVIKNYVNVSDCNIISSLLYRFRQQIDSKLFNFEKFDAMYQLYYNATAFSDTNQLSNYKIKEKKKNDDAGRGTEKKELKISEEQVKNAKDLAALLVSIVPNIVNVLYGAEYIAVPLVAALPIWEILIALKKIHNEKSKAEKFIAIIEEIGKNSNVMQRDEALANYFIKALNNPPKVDRLVNFFFLDNLQTNTFKDLHLLEKLLINIKAFWFISSREVLPFGFCHGKELLGLPAEAASSIITGCKNFLSLEKNNGEDICKNIISASAVACPNNEDILVNPIYIIAMCTVLEQQIEREIEKNPNLGAGYHIDAERFAKLDTESTLAYYFEMGKTDTELHCFHTLSCKAVWDEYTLSAIRNKLGLYLLNTKHILSSDSIVESVGKNSIKLHEKIGEQLLESPNNRIKYDVYEMMQDYFLCIQEKNPILNPEILESFFIFTEKFCEYVFKGIYKYRETSALKEYDLFFKAFQKSINKLGKGVKSSEFTYLFEKVVEKYVFLAEHLPNVNDKDKEEAYKSYYEYGLFLYNNGNSLKAIEYDKKYLSYCEKRNDSLLYATALNAVGVDLSGIHNYHEAVKYGQKSLEIIIDGLNKEVQKNPNDKLTKMLLENYTFYSLKYDSTAEICDVAVEKQEQMRTILEALKNTNENFIVCKLFEQLLRTRGNMPWYYILNTVTREYMSLYAIQFGKNTYQLRAFYYGQKNRATLTSYHNYAVYFMKYYENGLKTYYEIANVNYKEKFEYAVKLLKDVYQLRLQCLPKRDVSMKSFKQLEEEMENEQYQDKSIKFTDIFSYENITKLFPTEFFNKDYISKRKGAILSKDELADLLWSDTDALESMQYLSNAKFYLALSQTNVIDRNRILKEAIHDVEMVAIVRGFALGIYSKKTLESIRYAAEYYYILENQEEAIKRMEYAFQNLKIAEVGNTQYKEYLVLLEQMQKSEKLYDLDQS